MIVNQSALQQLRVGYSAAFNKGLLTVPNQYEKIATTVASATSEQTYAWLGQMPSMREWIGEREIQALSANGYTIKNKKFEMTQGVKRDAIEDDTYGTYTPLFANIGDCAGRHPEQLVFKALMNGFTEKCYDGKPYFAENHTISKGKEYSNLSDKKLSAESYEAARASIMSLVGEKGDSLGLIPDLLVVSPTNEKQARLILEADLINGTSNVNKGTASILVTPELAKKPEQWYLLCTNRFLKPIIYQERKKIKFTMLTNETDENVFMRDEFLYGADGRCNVGYGFPQMAYGSKGIA